jgi:N utilization substance protein B
MAKHIDRKIEELSPVERAVLMIGSWELLRSLDIPYRVVINEAVELTKLYGATDGHKFVNGVLDRIAYEVRTTETQARVAAT